MRFNRTRQGRKRSAAGYFLRARRGSLYASPWRRGKYPIAHFMSAAFLYAVFFFIASAVVVTPAFGSGSGPAVFIEKAAGTEQTSVFISGARLPEMRRITFTCVYSITHASIKNAIISSPQPATAISVHVDTTISTLSVSINAASTLLLPDNARMVVFKISNQSTGSAWPLTVTNATLIDKQNVSVEVPVSLKSSIATNGNSIESNFPMQMPGQPVKFFQINGRRITDSKMRTASGFYIHDFKRSYSKTIIPVR